MESSDVKHVDKFLWVKMLRYLFTGANFYIKAGDGIEVGVKLPLLQ